MIHPESARRRWCRIASEGENPMSIYLDQSPEPTYDELEQIPEHRIVDHPHVWSSDLFTGADNPSSGGSDAATGADNAGVQR
jgi:hypothetical protein